MADATKTFELRKRLLACKLGVSPEDLDKHIELSEVDEEENGFIATWKILTDYGQYLYRKAQLKGLADEVKDEA